VRVNNKNSLVIRDGLIDDAGVYTCSSGAAENTITRTRTRPLFSVAAHSVTVQLNYYSEDDAYKLAQSVSADRLTESVNGGGAEAVEIESVEIDSELIRDQIRKTSLLRKRRLRETLRLQYRQVNERMDFLSFISVLN